MLYFIYYLIDMKVRKRKFVYLYNILDLKKMLIYCYLEFFFFIINDLDLCCLVICLEMKVLIVKDLVSVRLEFVIVVKDRNYLFLLYIGVVCMY